MGLHSTPVSISLCMIVKNEERYLRRCLDSVRTVVDEIVIVDTGSTDRTPEIAQTYEARIIKHSWHDDFAAARNVGLEWANGDWILVLDADEELEQTGSVGLKTIVALARADGLNLRVRNFMPRGDLCKYNDVFITRLFRNRPAFRYEGSIHEQISPAICRAQGTTDDTDVLILHYGYAEGFLEGGFDRAQRNLKLLRKALDLQPDDPHLNYQAGITYKALGRIEAASFYLRRVLKLKYQELNVCMLDTLFMKLSQIELASNRYKDAIGYAELSLKLNAANAVSLVVAAISSMFLGSVQQAQHYFLLAKQCPQNQFADHAELDVLLTYCQQSLSRL